MMRRAGYALAALCVALAPVTVSAAGISTSDLGVVDGKDACMARATSVMQQYNGALGADAVEPGNWLVYGFGLKPGNQDAVIMCSASTTAGNDFRRAVLVVYGNAGDAELNATRDVIKGYWNAN